jgi:hypothetical protein
VSAIDRHRATAERRLHGEPVDVQLEGKAAVAECPPSRLPQKVAERTAQVVCQRLPHPSTGLLVVADPVQDPAIRLVTTDALSLFEQTGWPPGRSGRVLREQSLSPQPERVRRRPCLSGVPRQDPSSLAVDYESPRHR